MIENFNSFNFVRLGIGSSPRKSSKRVSAVDNEKVKFKRQKKKPIPFQFSSSDDDFVDPQEGSSKMSQEKNKELIHLFQQEIVMTF